MKGCALSCLRTVVPTLLDTSCRPAFCKDRLHRNSLSLGCRPRHRLNVTLPVLTLVVKPFGGQQSCINSHLSLPWVLRGPLPPSLRQEASQKASELTPRLHPSPDVSRRSSRPALFLATIVGVSVASLCPKGASEHETGNFLLVSLQMGPES